MSTNFHDPIVTGESNSPDTINTRLGTLDSGIQSARDLVDALILENGTTDAEVVAARTAIPYVAGTPPASLTATLQYINGERYSVDAYGAVGDGVTNDATAIAAAFTAAGAGDTVVFTPGKTYKCNSALTFNKAGGTILGYGATLDTSSLNGAALTITAQEVKVIGLTFVGEATAGSAGAPVSKDSLAITSSQNYLQVSDCRFEGYYKGGVRAQGDYVQIRGNTLVGVRNYDADHYGSIHVSVGTRGIITNNTILDVFDAGISLYRATRCTVSNNQIICTTEAGGSGSMGIYANREIKCCTFVSNVIRGAANEGIMLGNAWASSESFGNSITGNTIEDCQYTGITIRAASGGSGTESYNRYNSVVGNTIIVTEVPGATQVDYAILLDASSASNIVSDIAIVCNTIMGTSDGATKRIARGVQGTSSGAARITMVGNIVAGVGTGLYGAGSDNALIGNIVYNTGTAIQLQNAAYTMVTGNIVSTSATNSINYASGNTFPAARNNYLDRKPTAAPSSFYDNPIRTIGQTGSATLVAGTVTITAAAFGTTYSDGVISIERTAIGGTPGALYVSNINQASNQITVSSTSATDTSTFTWRLLR